MAHENAIESARQVTADDIKEIETNVATLGHVRLRHIDTQEIILVPTPSSDPKDPLNWFVCIFLEILLEVSSKELASGG
jgi:hypothetical protein